MAKITREKIRDYLKLGALGIIIAGSLTGIVDYYRKPMNIYLMPSNTWIVEDRAGRITKVHLKPLEKKHQITENSPLTQELIKQENKELFLK